MEVAVLIIGSLVFLFIGAFFGSFFTKRHLTRRAIGRIRIDHSEPDEPTRLFLELKGVTPDMIAQCDVVTFEVIDESYISPN